MWLIFNEIQDHDKDQVLNDSLFFFLPNLMHKFFILIHLLHSCTCFEHYCAHLQKDNCISAASGIVTVFDNTRCYTNTIVLLKMGTIVLDIYYIPVHVLSTVVLIFRRTTVLTT